MNTRQEPSLAGCLTPIAATYKSTALFPESHLAMSRDGVIA